MPKLSLPINHTLPYKIKNIIKNLTNSSAYLILLIIYLSININGIVSRKNNINAIGLVIYKPNNCPNILKIKLGMNKTGLEKFKPNVEPPLPSSKLERYSVRESKKPRKLAKNKTIK